MKNNYVIDTSAIITFLENERGADVVQDLLGQAEVGKFSIFLSFVTYMEIFYITIQKKGKPIAIERLDLLQSLPVTRVESTPELGKIAGQIKGK